MKISIILASLLLLVGCSTTVPVKVTFPEVPAIILEKCPHLQMLKEDVKLSDVSKTVTVNYHTYYDCAVKHSRLVEWYQIQKQLHDNVK